VVAKETVKEDEALSYSQYEPDECDGLRQRQRPGSEDQELYGEDRPKERNDGAGSDVPRQSRSDCEGDPQPDTALA
jgi:hypothetical protein